MIFSKIKKYYTFFISLGTNEDTPKSELKKIKLFNGFCGLWYLTTLAGIEDFSDESLRNTAIIVATSMNIGVIGIQYLHYKGHFYMARLLYIGSLLSLLFILANYVYPGMLMEYYLLFVPIMGLGFFDAKKLNYLILLAAYLCFILPNYYFKHYPAEVFNTVNMSWFFFGIFVSVNYFKDLNQKNEQALEGKTRELANLNRFQSQFFINISHEIRTPITLIKGQIDKLKTPSNAIPEAADIAERLDKQVLKITKMVDDVIDLAKMESSEFKLDMTPVSISELARRLYLSFEPLFQQKNIRFELIKNNKNYVVAADLVYLERALNNIIVNALKYTDKGGTVAIELKRNKQDIAVIVKDTGIGISKEDIDKIGNRFYQADNDINQTGGSGVGLAFSKEIITLHRGKLQIKSTLRQGSSFKIILPLRKVLDTAEPADSIKITTRTENYQKLVPVKDQVILIVDDSAEMRSYLKNIFRESTCIEAENGIEALDILKEHEADMIITDYMMPKMNGLQLVTTLKAQRYQNPVLMLTARTDNESKLSVLRLGVDDYLTKPFEKEELIIRVQNAMKNHKSRLNHIEEEKLTDTEIEQNSQWIHKVKAYVEKECIDPNLKQADIAAHFNLSLSTLYRKIKGETGLSPNEFIKEVKLQKARKIAENNTEISLKQLSLEVGYYNNSYFATIYRNRFGVNPLRKSS